MLRRARAHATAALVFLHIFAITLIALPAPGGGMNRRAWKEPTVRDELQAWQGRTATRGG